MNTLAWFRVAATLWRYKPSQPKLVQLENAQKMTSRKSGALGAPGLTIHIGPPPRGGNTTYDPVVAYKSDLDVNSGRCKVGPNVENPFHICLALYGTILFFGSVLFFSPNPLVLSSNPYGDGKRVISLREMYYICRLLRLCPDGQCRTAHLAAQRVC